MQKFLILIAIITLVGCVATPTHDKPTVTVSIAPLAYLVEQIADTTVNIEVLVPETTSPETYEPTVRQVQNLGKSTLYFTIGLIDFEQALTQKIESSSPQTTCVNLSQGLELLEGTCGHDHGNASGHHHGVDPHIWLSPSYMKAMAENITTLLCEHYPERATLYRENFAVLASAIDTLDAQLQDEFAHSAAKSFAIVHPSLTYFARDYGLRQLSLEVDGKEPGAQQIKALIDTLRTANVRHILYSRQTPDASARAVAKELGADVVEYDPLSRDWKNNMKHLANLICN